MDSSGNSAEDPIGRGSGGDRGAGSRRKIAPEIGRRRGSRRGWHEMRRRKRGGRQPSSRLWSWRL